MIVRRSQVEVEKIQQAGLIVADALELAEQMIEPGTRTKDMDRAVEDFIKKSGGKPAFKGYRGYPSATCISVNKVVVHGIPGPKRLTEGELVGIDVGVELDGYFADAAFTSAVGQTGREQMDLLNAGREALKAGIEKAVSGNYLYDISGAIQRVAEASGYSVVREFVGHGIGQAMHEEPQIPNYVPDGRGPRLDRGMVLALEPMVNLGTGDVEVLDDKWTVVTKDGRPSVHFEHTIVVTEGAPRILTDGR